MNAIQPIAVTPRFVPSQGVDAGSPLRFGFSTKGYENYYQNEAVQPPETGVMTQALSGLVRFLSPLFPATYRQNPERYIQQPTEEPVDRHFTYVA